MRINAIKVDGKNNNNVNFGDLWSPARKITGEWFDLGEEGKFNYKKFVQLLSPEDWILPPLAEISPHDQQGKTLALVAQSLAHGQSKTGGFHSRIVPLSGKVSLALGPKRAELHQLAQAQVETIAKFDEALRHALALAAVGGEWGNQDRRVYYKFAQPACAHLDRYADEIFFEHLWARFEAQEAGTEALRKAEKAFAAKLWQRTEAIFEQSLPSMPCASLFRPRAEARARAVLRRMVRKRYPELFQKPQQEEVSADAA